MKELGCLLGCSPVRELGGRPWQLVVLKQSSKRRACFYKFQGIKIPTSKPLQVVGEGDVMPMLNLLLAVAGREAQHGQGMVD